jgi:L,D-transpeptidase YcbB
MRLKRFLSLAAIGAACFAAGPIGSTAMAQQARLGLPQLETGSIGEMPPAASTAAPSSASPLTVALRLRLADPGLDATDDERAAILASFEARGGTPLWVDASGLTPAGARIREELAKAGDWGLDASDFDLEHFPAPHQPVSADRLTEAELQVSLAALKYARFARGGRIWDPAKQLASTLDRKPQLLAPRAVFEALVASPDPDAVMRGFHPQHDGFKQLRKAYLEARAANHEGDSADIAPGPSLRPGAVHADIAVARGRLKVPAAEGLDPAAYDEAMVAAVTAFQAAQGLTPADGIIGNKTRAALNTLKSTSPERLLVNMEQWRWMPDDLGEMYIWVNIPEFTIRVIKNKGVIHTERVVTGLPTNQTPAFSDAMATVVLHPNWVVPDSIKVNEVLPSLTGRGDMFWRNGLKIKRGETDIDPGSVNWWQTDIRNYQIYQPPGDTNVLGQVKFLFPNKHAVYMHDTPSKALFNNAERAYSHGCMRVRNPLRLAELVLMHDKGWTAERVAALINDGPEDNRITLDRKIPVHVTYFTARVEDDGTVKSFRDVYGHEQRMQLALDGRWSEIQIPEDHLTPTEDREFDSRAMASGRSSRHREARAEPPAKKSNTVENVFRSLFGGF